MYVHRAIGIALFVKGYTNSQHLEQKIMAKSHLKLITPTTENRTVTPTRRPNAELRTREYLTETEVEGLTEAAKGNRTATATPP